MDYSTNILSANIWIGNISLDQVPELLKTSNYTKFILMGQYEHCHWNFPTFNQILDIAKERNITIDVVSGAGKILNDIPRMSDYNLYYYPTAFFTSFLKYNHNLLDKIIIKDVTTLEYKYHFLSMNRLAHQHRSEMLDILSMYDLIDTNAMSWHNLEPYPYQYNFWSPKVLTLTDTFAEDWNAFIIPQEFYNSFAQLVVESTTDEIFVTEKTIAPLFLGKPFMVASCQGFHKYLETLGFKMYDEIFDYSFDDEPNQTMRFSMIADNFRKLSRVPLDDLPELARIIKEKVEHNKLLSYKLATDYTYYPTPMEELVNVYENTGTVLEPLTIGDYTKIKSLRKNITIF